MYPPIQVLNRDLSITMIRLFAERRLRDKMAKELKKEGLEQEAITKRLAEIDWTEKVRHTPRGTYGAIG
jgi:tRNA G26 N,N-dimethylase Trm1